MHHVNRAQSVTRCQHPVEGTRGTASLDVSEDDGTRFKAGAFLDFVRQRVADAAQLFVAELILAEVAHDESGFAARRELGAFSGDHNAELTSTSVPLTDQFGNLFDVKGHFGNQDHIRAASHATVDGDPAGIAAHHFHNDHAVVRFGGGVNAINCAGGDVDSSVEAKREVSACEIIIDGFRHAHDL